MGWATIPRVPAMVSSGPPKGMMGNSDSVCSVAHAAGGVSGVGEGAGWEAQERGGWRGARGGGEGVLLTYRSVNGGKELLTSPNAHTLQKDTTPSSWRQRESTERKQGGTERGGRQETKTQGETGVRYCRNTCIWVLRLHRRTRQQGRTSTVFYVQHTNLIVTHRQTRQTQAEQEFGEWWHRCGYWEEVEVKRG